MSGAKSKATSLNKAARGAAAHINKSYAARHPARAAEERRLRKANRAAQANFGHKVHGTVQTHAHAARVRQGAMARLYQSGAINADQLAAAAHIAQIVERIGRDVSVRTVSLETRVDQSGAATRIFDEALGAVRAEMAYSRWRSGLSHAGVILSIIADDEGIAQAARRHRMGVAKAKRLLMLALDQWDEAYRAVAKEVDAATLAAAQAGIL